ncbi:hypothetical protein ACHAXT_001011 [Thalassiosira profunda]
MAAANIDAADNSPAPPRSPLLYDVLGSATAGIISRIVTHPLDTAKARLQAPTAGGQSPFRGPLDALIRTYRREGIRALYGGFGAVIVGGTPGTVIYLTGYAFFRDSLSSLVSKRNEDSTDTSRGGGNGRQPLSHGQEFAIHFSSGMLAEAVTCIIYVPVDVVKERMQVQQTNTSRNPLSQGNSQTHPYKGSWDALRRILQTEGMRGIYKGYGATLGSFGPFSALYFVFYERCKFWAKEYNNRQRRGITGDAKIIEDGELPLLHLVACSASAGALASWLTSPLDMAKLRLQVQRGQAAAVSSNAGRSTIRQTLQYRNALHCLSVAYREGGMRGLFRGAGARVLHFAPATAVTMTSYEKCRSFYAQALG